MFWFVLNSRWIWLDKRKNVSENLLKVRGHLGFLIFSHLQHKIFVAKTTKKKIQRSLIFFVCFLFLFHQQNILGKKLQNKEI